ncbi:hypothetical protein CJ030_MR2G013628 [Morella rubra]|uniref:Uncharacterized protein n=1 Tax=Morella rubra TaxID=262757 RepID=A0A6A1WC66_9ROSI|nr:hypothetical protein CJ030_MR2G013628 [Morella rubra]
MCWCLRPACLVSAPSERRGGKRPPLPPLASATAWKSTFIATFCRSFDVSDLGVSSLRDFYSDYLFQSWLCANLEMKPEWLERDNMTRMKGISVEEFVLNFEEPNKPMLLEGCLDNWVACEKWDRNYLVQLYGDVRFAVGPVEMKLEEYFRYSDQAREERPLYLFDPKFADKVPKLGLEYKVPVYFTGREKLGLFSVHPTRPNPNRT